MDEYYKHEETPPHMHSYSNRKPDYINSNVYELQDDDSLKEEEIHSRE
jgi:hypothetical protein